MVSLYLVTMVQLPNDHSWLHNRFVEDGYCMVRRSAREWAGVSTDLTIEQTMRQAVKGRSGLTHGRGMTDSVRLTWVRTIYAALCALTVS